MTPRIIPGSDRLTVFVPHASKTYGLTEERIAGLVDGMDSVIQAAYHIVMTERYAYPIYPDSYGIELERYIGRDISYLAATIEDTLRDALTQDDRILDVAVRSVEKGDAPDGALVTFELITSLGRMEMGVSVRV